jgi:gluconokinase
MEYILGIDIGTGSTKAVAVGMDHIAFDSSQYFYPTDTTTATYSEQDPEQIWKAFQYCIEELVSKLKSPPLAISLSTAMHSLIAVDAQCNALAPMMTWADSRSTAIAEQLLASPVGMELYRETGTPVHPMSPLCKIIWIREKQPAFFATVSKFISIKEYIWYRLFKVFQVDHSIASCSGLMDVEQLVWSDLAMKTAGISSTQLSELVATTYLRKDFDPAASMRFLDPATPFVMGASDGCLANLGTGAITPGVAALTIGTSGALRMASHEALFNKKAMTFSYRMDDQIFINGGPVNNGGVALKWHLKNIFQRDKLTDEDYKVSLATMETVAPGAEGLIFLPYLQGERAPIWDSKSCGNFFGIRLKHQTKHFTRAVVEGICFALNDVLKSLEASGQPIIQLNVSGGFVSSSAWLQILADITGKRLVLATTEDASAVGAAYLAVKATGRSEVYPSPVQNESSVVEANAVNHQLYNKYFILYQKLYVNLKHSMDEMYALQNKS